MKKAQHLLLQVTLENKQVLWVSALIRVLVLPLDISLTLDDNLYHAYVAGIIANISKAVHGDIGTRPTLSVLQMHAVKIERSMYHVLVLVAFSSNDSFLQEKANATVTQAKKE